MPSKIAATEQVLYRNKKWITCFSVPRKSEMAGLLKQRMLNRHFFFPLLSWEQPYRGEVSNELNLARYVLRKDGAVGFYHHYGTHDDVFWGLVLAVYATTEMTP